jgi:tetratricopeptide (TPR) repeat protein
MSFWLAESYLREGDWSRAFAVVEPVLVSSREGGYRHFEGVALRLLGQSLVVENPIEAAAHLDAAIRILESTGARNDLAKALVAHAQLARGAGNVEEARNLLERALAIFEALGSLDEPPRVRGDLDALRRAASAPEA